MQTQAAAKNRSYTFGGYRLAYHGGGWHAAPAWLGDLEFADELVASHPAVLTAGDRRELEERIRRISAAREIEYIGWFPAYEQFGDCGNHPQFSHLEVPPEGWHFTRSAPLFVLNPDTPSAATLDELLVVLARNGLISASDPIGAVVEVVARKWQGTGYDLVFRRGRYWIVASGKAARVCGEVSGGSATAPELLVEGYGETGYNIIAAQGRFYGIAQSDGSFDLDRIDRGEYGHPVFIGKSLEATKAKIDRGAEAASVAPPRLEVENYQGSGYNVVGFRGRFYALARADGEFDVAVAEAGLYDHPVYVADELSEVLACIAGRRDETTHAMGVRKGEDGFASLDDALSVLCERTATQRLPQAQSRPLIVFEGLMGNPLNVVHYGSVYYAIEGKRSGLYGPILRPEFRRIWHRTAGAVIAALRLIPAVFDLFVRALANGCTVRNFVHFLRTRSLSSQMLLRRSCRLVFVPSVPFFLGQYPWVIEVEDFISLCFPYLHNGRTKNITISDSPYYPALKALLESPRCRAILSHVRATAESLPKAFKSPALARKVHYVPMGVALPQLLPRRAPREQVNLLFTSSWHQDKDGFYVRGGLDVLHAFRGLACKYEQVRLVFRSPLPAGEPAELFERLVEETGGRVLALRNFVPAEEWRQLFCDTDLFLLPSARIHVISILEAMSYGLTVLVSDGWGIEEYVEDGRTGVIVRGRYGRVSWNDPVTGMFHEDYEPMYQPDPAVVERMVAAASALIENPATREHIGRAARREIEVKYNLANWNAGLRACLDAAAGRGRGR